MRSFNANPIVNIVRAEIVTKENQPRVLHFETVSSASPEPFISEGEESELRIRNTILAQERLEDIIKGYNITLKDCVMSRELLELIDGGQASAGTSNAAGSYQSPLAGQESARTHFTLHLYAVEKDYAGDPVAYFRFSFPNCVGTPAKFSLENGSFTTPEYVVRSRPSAGKCAMAVVALDTLPAYCTASSQLPSTPAAGYCMVAGGSMRAGSVDLVAGDLAFYTGSAYVKAGVNL